MKCAHFQQRLSLFMRAELDGVQLAECEDHLRSCQACAQLLDDARQLDRTLSEIAQRDEERARPRLQSLEQKLWAAWRQESRPETSTRQSAARPSPLAWRLSLAFNGLCLAALVALLLFPPALSRLLERRPTLPPPSESARLSTRDMRELYGQVEGLFGSRLRWVAENAGAFAMGIANDPAGAAPAPGAPVVALVYWLGAQPPGPPDRSPFSAIILTRPGEQVRLDPPPAERSGALDIVVSSLSFRRGQFTVATEIRPSANAPREGPGMESVSSLSSSVTLPPGAPAKLGQIRVGDTFQDAYLAVTIIQPGEDNHENLL